MSEQALDLRRSARIVWQRKIAVIICAVLGILAGVGATMYRPPMPTSEALVNVVLPPTEQGALSVNGSAAINPAIATQLVIADSTPVLQDALRAIHPSVSLPTLRGRVQVTSLATSDVLSISAAGMTATQAKATAEAVAVSYLAYTRRYQSGQVQARLLAPAIDGAAPSLPASLLLTGGLGMLAGAILGAIAVVAFSRKNKRLRKRDEIADSVAVPVLASIQVARPSNAAAWVKLLAGYEPEGREARHLSRALQQLNLADIKPNGSRRHNLLLEVVSFSFDPGALAIGPQLAVFAASRGIPTALVVCPQQDVKAVATLRTACAVPTTPKRPTPLQVIVRDHDGDPWPADNALTVAVAVVDGRQPRLANAMRANATVLGVSAGVATAEQLAAVAAAAGAGGRDITGILVANPEPGDPTTGRFPQVARVEVQRGPTRMTGAIVETRL